MDFPVELVMNNGLKGLALKVSSLEIFGGKRTIIPEDKITRLGFFSITSEYKFSENNYTIQDIENKLKELGKNNANAYRVIRKTKSIRYKPYQELETTTFQSYKIPEELAEEERKNKASLSM